jgi:TetR/AcrR family transcriptional regulator, cholesterol catabolism regulator
MKSRSNAPSSASAIRSAAVRRSKAVPAHAVPATAKKRTHRRSAEIIEAAAQVFAERGYHGATTQDIADVLNIRQASLYYYFPSKEVALEVVCMRGVEGFFERARGIADGPGTASEQLGALMRAHIAPILDRHNFMKVFLTQRQFLPADSRRKVGKGSRGIETIFETVIRDGQRSGEFRKAADARIVTLSLLSMLNGCAAWYGHEHVSLDRVGDEFVSFALHGLAAGRAGGQG